MFYYLVYFNWKSNGTCEYTYNEKYEDFSIGVPKPEGGFEERNYVGVSECDKEDSRSLSLSNSKYYRADEEHLEERARVD